MGFPDYWTECDDAGDLISDTKRYLGDWLSRIPAWACPLPTHSALAITGRLPWVWLRQVPGLDATIRLCCRRSQRAKFQCLDLESGQTPEWYEAEALLSLGVWDIFPEREFGVLPICRFPHFINNADGLHKEAAPLVREAPSLACH